MKKRFSSLSLSRQIFWLALLPISFLRLNFAFLPASTHSVRANELPQERELYRTLPGENQEGTILDATNPMDLMNRLRRATAMNNATSPADAVDEALRALDANNEGASLLKPD